MKYILLFVTAMVLIGCGGLKGQPKPLPINARDQLDAITYDSVASAQGALKSFRKDFGALDESHQTYVRPFLNQAIKAYDVAETAWHAYHDGTGDPQALSKDVADLTAAITNLQAAMPQTKPGK